MNLTKLNGLKAERRYVEIKSLNGDLLFYGVIIECNVWDENSQGFYIHVARDFDKYGKNPLKHAMFPLDRVVIHWEYNLDEVKLR